MDIICDSLNSISSTTLGYVDPTSSIQTQLDAKIEVRDNNTFTGNNELNTGTFNMLAPIDAATSTF